MPVETCLSFSLGVSMLLVAFSAVAPCQGGSVFYLMPALEESELGIIEYKSTLALSMGRAMSALAMCNLSPSNMQYCLIFALCKCTAEWCLMR